jgi:molybdopterin synthase sulfur carrier subunit
MVLKKHSTFMPKIKVRFFANFREFTKTSELELQGDTVRDILEKICNKFPGLDKILFKNKNLQPYVNIFLNGENVPGSDELDKCLHQGDEIAIFPPVSGG